MTRQPADDRLEIITAQEAELRLQTGFSSLFVAHTHIKRVRKELPKLHISRDKRHMFVLHL